MSKEYSKYPFEVIRITQRHDGIVSHKPHWYKSKNYSDKPWDEASKDGGRQYFIPQNDFKIEQIIGLNGSATNAVRLKSVNKIYMPYKDSPDYLSVTLTHMNEDTIKKLKVGQIIKKGSKVILEGKDGASAYHFHVTANIGKYYGLLKNSNGKWCFTYDKALLPDEAFYVDKKCTIIKNAAKYSFKEVPSGSFFPAKGYFKKGDTSPNIGKICKFYADKFYGYFCKNKTEAHKLLDGNYFGENCYKWTKEFQKRCKEEGLYKDKIDGSIGPKTLKCLEHFGFKK